MRSLFFCFLKLKSVQRSAGPGSQGSDGPPCVLRSFTASIILSVILFVFDIRPVCLCPFLFRSLLHSPTHRMRRCCDVMARPSHTSHGPALCDMCCDWRLQDHSGALMAEEFKACLISLGYDVENDKQVREREREELSARLSSVSSSARLSLTAPPAGRLGVSLGCEVSLNAAFLFLSSIF